MTSKDSRSAEPSYERFRVMSNSEPSVEMAGLRGEIRVWCDRPFNEYADTFLEVFELLARPIRDQLTWYQNYTMDRFSVVTQRTWSSPRTWLTRGKQEVARSLHLKGPDELQAAGRYVLHYKYHPDEALYSDSNTPFIRRATPAEHLASDPEGFLETARQLCDLLPFLCGHVGYCLEISPYFEPSGQRAAYPLAMRHPGINIASHHATWPLRDEKGVETVNWLTLVGEIPLGKLGGIKTVRAALSGTPGVDVVETQHGLILKAGDIPQIGDTNRREDLPLYRAVYRVLLPVMDPIIKRFRPFILKTDDNIGRTERWLRRFES
jgi:hypothetical protein